MKDKQKLIFLVISIIMLGVSISYYGCQEYDNLPESVKNCASSGCGCSSEEMSMLQNIWYKKIFGFILIISGIILLTRKLPI